MKSRLQTLHFCSQLCWSIYTSQVCPIAWREILIFFPGQSPSIIFLVFRPRYQSAQKSIQIFFIWSNFQKCIVQLVVRPPSAFPTRQGPLVHDKPSADRSKHANNFVNFHSANIYTVLRYWQGLNLLSSLYDELRHPANGHKQTKNRVMFETQICRFLYWLCHM